MKETRLNTRSRRMLQYEQYSVTYTKEIVRILQRKGFIPDQSKGSHQIGLHPVSRKGAIVPVHNKSIPTGTLYAILKNAGIDKEEL